ncbi:hypothetical protein NECID01_1481 [Nematocida sp. AWRm77]|nr:hypothetical protein NECID01_1481 [Nematocida sp. AWRm77]
MNCSNECACSNAMPAKSLLSAVDMGKVSALNEKEKGSCLSVIQKAQREKGGPVSCAKDPKGLLVKIPFMHKVNITKIELRSSFGKMEVVPNNMYVGLTGPCKKSDTFSLSLPEHIVPVSLPPYNYKSVDHLAIRLTETAQGFGEAGSLSYLSLYGVITGSLPSAVNVSYELYSVGEKVQDEGEKHHAKIHRL